jgi:HlyD family secretion protein
MSAAAAWRLGVSVAALAIVLVFAGQWLTGRSAAKNGHGPLFTVEKGPLTISVTEPGTIKPRDQITVICEVEGRSTILDIVPEGTHVKKGDFLVQLDVTAQEDTRVNLEIVVQNAEAQAEQARENLENVKTESEADLDRVSLNLRFATEDLDQYKNGEFPSAVKELEARIVLAERDLERARERLKWSQKLFEERYLAEADLRADELAVRKAELDVELAASALALLRDFTYKRRMVQLESDIKQASRAVDRSRRMGGANTRQAEVALRARESELRQHRIRLGKVKEQIEKGRIVAPRDGMVVYATSAQGDWRGNREPLAAGQIVREREELICLPTASTFMAEVKVHESNLDKIRVGLPVRVTVDALPGRLFVGRVDSVAILPDAASMFMNPDLKLYRTEIHIDEGSDILRTGMSCSAEIVVEEHASALFVPIQCVVVVKGMPTAFVVAGAGAQPREVRLGLDNNRMVRILDGLSSGDRVLLSPPLSAGVQPDGNVSRRPIARIVDDAGASANASGAASASPSAGREGEAQKTEAASP